MSETLTDKEIEDRLRSPDNLINRLEIHKKGNNRENPNIPDEIRKTVSILANYDDSSGNEIAEAFGLNAAQVSHAKKGRNSSGTECEALKEIVKEVDANRARAENLAINAILQGIPLLEGKLSSVKQATHLSTVISNLANTAEKLRDKNKGDGNSPFDLGGVHLHLHVPKQKVVDDYDVIDV